MHSVLMFLINECEQEVESLVCEQKNNYFKFLLYVNLFLYFYNNYLPILDIDDFFLMILLNLL